MSRLHVPYILVTAGASLLAFAVVNAVLLYYTPQPRTALNLTAGPFAMTLRDFPDPYAVALTAVRALLLLAIGLIGTKLLEVGLRELREADAQRRQTYQYEPYYRYEA